MRVGIAQLAAALLVFAAAAPAPQRHTAPKRRPPKTAAKPRSAPPPLPCGDFLSFQVLLDRQGFSPGEIDGKPGPNLTHALAAAQATHNVQSTGQPDCDTWHALGGDTAGQLIATYTVSDEDVKGPFEPNIPADMSKQAALPSLNYRTPLERLAEKFHVSPALLQTMNTNVQIEPGASLSVPAVMPFDVDQKPAADPALADVTIEVSREESALRALRTDGKLAFFAPVTTGSEHDPLPIGDWKVLGTRWLPPFHYNPRLFWDAKPGDARTTIKPGPNNPVGVVWISINKEHYGLHGTPEPGHIGHAESHGCVRLTNWDAARVASMVKPGTPVRFQ